MRRFGYIYGALTLLASMACRDPVFPAGTRGHPPSAAAAAAPAAEMFIVVFRPGTQDVRDLATRLATDHGGEVTDVYEHALQGFAVRISAQEVADIRRHPDVAFVEADARLTASVIQANATWGLDRIDQRKLPLSTTYTYNASGSGVTVYVIDNGIRKTHQEFGDRATLGFTAYPDEIDEVDCGWHGTHVAGTIGGTVYGVAKQVSLVDVRVMDCSGDGTVSKGIAGVDWVTANHVKPAVANMSLAASSVSDAFDLAVANSIAAGVTYVIAAGNDNADACNSSPARVVAAMTVGSTTETDNKAPTSNYGSCLDLFAPGDLITSASNWSDSDTKLMSGTSMATPHVAGVAALLLQGDPRLTPSGVGRLIIQNATTGKVKRPGAGSPSRLLYSGFIGGRPAN